ncbi:hypothetical protein RBU60_09235 [Mesonia sp. MT50]|uniref:Beta-carotene 15,15'-monooxygenase n=1 Tax=Mesonia profundi TaxID=3070998 RepID=A0ABU1A254_9FLAO|nr:hypothetical protein [Mesonia profundi]MDQ7917757.1 hypothetical protein [Mesonia profundi]
MDGLELLKKDWKNQEENLPHFEAEQLYKMLLKKSSSVVKWIFIISLIELSFGILLNVFFMDKQFWQEVDNIHLKTATIVIYIISYLITAGFVVFFYKRYRTISVADSSYLLMRNILKTRKVVKCYIIYVLVSSGITMMLFYIYSLLYTPGISENLEEINWLVIIGIGVISILLFLLFLWGVYALLYGILLKKLLRNYKELKNLDF